jgi:hypothetical protein
MRFVPLSESDGSWSRMKSAWQSESSALNEDFSTFTIGSLGPLDAIASKQTSGLFALEDDETVHAFCQASRLLVKEYPLPVLRVRFVTVSPRYDLGVLGTAEYAQIMVQLLSGVVWLARGQLPAHRIRFHLKSPADAQFFTGLQMSMLQENPFSDFQVRGAWLDCPLKETETDADADEN